MIRGWRRNLDRVRSRAIEAQAARDRQHRLATRLQRSARHWMGQAETLAWLGVTGFVWGARVRDNRRSDDDLRPVRELAGAAWVVLSWRRLPGRVRRLARQFDPAGTPPPRHGAAHGSGSGPTR